MEGNRKEKLKEQPKEIDPRKLFSSAVDYIKGIEEQIRSKEMVILRDYVNRLMNLFENVIDMAINFAVGLAKIEDDKGKMKGTFTQFPFGPLLDPGFCPLPFHLINLTLKKYRKSGNLS